MKTIFLNDPIYKELHILKKSEYEKIGPDFSGRAFFDNNIKCAFLPGYGTTLFYENRHFIIITDNQPLYFFDIWRNHKIIGHCNITLKAAEKANKATNAEFYFSRKGKTNGI